MPALEKYLHRPFTPVPPEVLAAIDAGPIDPDDALPQHRIDRLLDPEPLPVEIGYCRMRDGVGYSAMRTRMPPGSPEMMEWWFKWHADEDIRYRIWHPRAHRSNRLDPVTRPADRPYWTGSHHPVEDVGVGMQKLCIQFRPPEDLGYSPGAEDRPGVARVFGGFVGDDTRRVWHTKMTHVLLEDGDGFVLRSRFWVGSILRPYGPLPLANFVGRLINRPLTRRVFVPGAVPRGLALHCAEEYNHLAVILPELYAEYGP